jgi:hypothetical protein
MLVAAKSSRVKRPIGFPQSFFVAGAIAGILVGFSIAVPQRHSPSPSKTRTALALADVDHLSREEIEALIVKGLMRLGEDRDLASGTGQISNDDSAERTTASWKDVQRGVNNVRRLLAPVRVWTLEALRSAAGPHGLKTSDQHRLARLIRGVKKIVPTENLSGIAAVRDDHLTEILVDCGYATYLSSDDEAVFVLAHELTHIAARSGGLAGFFESVADEARRNANVEPTSSQKEDLACDFVGELVLKRFIALNPNSDSEAARVSRVFGYQSAAERFARAWQDFCASYNGDPGDEEHLTQYQTIRALSALDPHLRSLMPLSIESTGSSH